MLRGLKQTGRSEIAAGVLLSALRDRISNHGKSVWPTTRLTELKDLAEKENRMAEVESKAVISDFLNGPEHIADTVRDEGLAIPLSEGQEYG